MHLVHSRTLGAIHLTLMITSAMSTCMLCMSTSAELSSSPGPMGDMGDIVTTRSESSESAGES